eukprot:PITA_03228
MGVKKGPWSPEEDRKLSDYIQKHGFGNWRAIPRQAGLLRCGKSCRLRWTNYLRPDLKRGSLSPEEEQTIIRLHGMLGNRWSTIASYLPGRTDNEIKNIWNTHLKKRLTETNSVWTHPVSSTVRTTRLAINNCLSKSPAMQNSHCFPASPNSECIFSDSKDSAPQFTADEMGLHGAENDQHLWETGSAHRHETNEKRSEQDYLNSLKKFLDISEESSSQEHGSEDYDIAEILDPVTEDYHTVISDVICSHYDIAGILDPVTEDYYTVISDYINPEVFCSFSTSSGNQLAHETSQTSLADHLQEYCSNSPHVHTTLSFSPDFLLDRPEKPIDVPDIVNSPLWND